MEAGASLLPKAIASLSLLSYIEGLPTDRITFRRLGIEGASTHSFRRTAITWMHNERVPIKHIQSISERNSLSALQRYIDVTEKDKEMAIASLNFRS